MWRILPLALGFALLLPSTAEAKEKPVTFTHNGETVQITISHDVFTIDCDGDSFAVKVKAPPGLPVRIDTTDGVTDKHGTFTADIVPETDGIIRRATVIYVRFPDATVGYAPFVYSCPFDGPYDLKLHVERKGKPYKGDVRIGLRGNSFSSSLPFREFDLHRGDLDITALHSTGWRVCAEKGRVASVDGVLNPSTNLCQSLPPLDGHRIAVVIE